MGARRELDDMSRRTFLGACARIGAGVALSLSTARTAAARGPGRGGEDPSTGLDPTTSEILRYASLAPSGHNAQPWRVRIVAPDRWAISANSTRTLPAVDPAHREVMLGLGAFVENLVLAAGALGRDTEVSVNGTDPCADGFIDVRLERSAATGYPVERIARRRVVRRRFRRDDIRSSTMLVLANFHGDGFAYFPNRTPQATYLRESAVEAFRAQSIRDDAQHELAGWFRFGDDEVRRRRDGITPATMELGRVARWYANTFLDSTDVMSDGFRRRGIDLAAGQARESGGWIVLTSPGDTPTALVDAGRRFERMFLAAREQYIAIHPMSQVLEEEPWREQVAAALGVRRQPQFILRTGYLDEYPEPASPRRPVAWFVTPA